jgi:hypothetical protein
MNFLQKPQRLFFPGTRFPSSLYNSELLRTQTGMNLNQMVAYMSTFCEERLIFKFLPGMLARPVDVPVNEPLASLPTL